MPSLPSSHRPRIAFLVDAILARYQIRLHAGARRAAARLGVDFVSFFGGYFSGNTESSTRLDGSFIYDLASPPAVDGILLTANILSSDAGSEWLDSFCQRQRTPIVAIGELQGVPHVAVDNSTGLRAVLEHLVCDHGLKRFGFIRGSEGNPDTAEREEVFRQVMSQHRLHVPDDWVLPGTFLELDGTHAVQALADERGVELASLDGIVAANDAMAAGALRELAARGLRVPQDIAVVGFDDDDHARYSSPPLTTVAQPVEALAERGVELLVDALQGLSIPERTVVNTEPILRHSCGCALLPSPLTVAVPDPRKALEDQLEKLRDACRERLRRLLGDPAHPAQPGADEIIDVLLATLRDEDPDYRELEQHVVATAERGIDPLRWHDVVDRLDGEVGRHRLRDPEGTARCERVLLQIHLMISQVAARTQSLEQLHTTQRANALRVLGSALVSAASLSGLDPILKRALPGLAVEFCCVLLFVNEADRKLVRVAALHDIHDTPIAPSLKNPDQLMRAKDILFSLGSQEGPISEEDIPSSTAVSLLPPSLRLAHEDRSLAVYPLTFARQALGYVVFHEPKHTGLGWIYEGIAGYLSTAVYVLRQSVSLRRARETAEKASAAKSEFLANMSHEIRTPITAVIGYLDLALSSAPAPRQKYYLEQGLAASRALTGIVNDILDFSKIEARRLELEQAEFLIDEVIDQVVSSCGMSATQKDLELVVDVSADVPETLVGDPLRLGQVLMNLVGNAIKFTERGEVVFHVAPVSAGTGEVLLRFLVRDTGIGIPTDKLERLADPFTQGDTSTTRRFGGTGLGLTISKRLIQMMGGELTIESVVEQGSTFAFTARFGGSLDQQVPSSSPTPRELSVLVVDDSRAARQALCSLLTMHGFRVDVAECGEDALALLLDESRHYDLVLLDHRLPGLDGLQIARFISTLPQLASTPAILMASLNAPELLTSDSQQGAIRAVVTKPIRRQSLLTRVDQVLLGGTNSWRPVGGGLDEETAAILKGRRVLLVEDNEVNREVASELLQLAGLEVDIATNGQEAVRRLCVGQHDAVLMDLHMPVMDGVQATRAIRANSQLPDVPIIAMTASTMSEDRERCLKAGMDDHLSTPIAPSRLYTTLARWIGRGTTDGASTDDTKSATVPTAATQPIAIQLTGAVSTAQGALATTSALERISGNVSLYRRLLEKFSEGHRRSPSAIREALARGDFRSATQRVHSLSGAAGNVGAAQVSDIARRLERALQDERRIEAQDLLVELNEAISTVLPAMAAVIGQKCDPSPPPPNPDE